jgi:uncharacterized radical SAM superfamily protein
LVSGGYNGEGYVPFEPFVDALRHVKEETGLFVSIHPGLMPSRLITELSDAGVDAVDFDLIGSDETAEMIFGFRKGSEEYQRVLEDLARGIPHVAPHICIGLHGGKLKGERRALEIAAEADISALVFLVLVPTPDTPFEGVQPPSPAAVGELISEARLKFPEIPIALGCMRPRGNGRVETELQALKAGIDRIELPSAETLENARAMGLEVKRLDACCAVPSKVAEAWSRD